MNRKRILVVDDDKDFTESMGELIELEGHQPVLAYNGREALKIFKQNNIDIILVDYKMPGLNGIDTLLEIRKLNSTIPVVIMTAYANENLVKDAKKQGAFGVLDKPFDIDKLRKIFSSFSNLNNILLLEDDKDFADSLTISLSEEGHTVFVAYDTQQAINYISENDIHLQIIDLRLNGKTGIDFWYFARKTHPGIPTIFISGYADQYFNQIEEIMQLSQIDVLEKPFAHKELINKIRSVNF